MSQENVEVFDRALEAFNRRDAASFAVLCADDVEIVPLRAALEATVYRGPNAVATFFAALVEDWTDLGAVEIEAIHDGDDWVLGTGRYRARGRSSGVPVETRLSMVMRFRDGLATSLRTYAEPADALETVGLRE